MQWLKTGEAATRGYHEFEAGLDYRARVLVSRKKRGGEGGREGKGKKGGREESKEGRKDF